MPKNVTIDKDGRTTVDGKPFFLIGARHMPENGTPEILRDAGFNAFRVLPFGHETSGPEPIPDKLEGIYFWDYVYNRVLLSKSGNYERELREHVRQVSRHPGLFCYENLNEVTMRTTEEGHKCTPAELERGTALLRGMDPQHPVWICYHCSNTVETLRKFNRCGDAFGCNPYPVYSPRVRDRLVARPDGRILDCPDQSLHAVGKYTDKMRAVTRDKMPVWMLVQGVANEHWGDTSRSVRQEKPLYPSYEQIRFMAWDEIVSGAKGLAFSMCRTPTVGPIWADISRVVGELSRHQDILASPTPRGSVAVRYTDLGFTIWDGVRTTMRRKPKELYLFAVNTSFDPAEVTFRVPVPIKGTALVIGEGRDIPIHRNSFSDRFAPFSVHLYRCNV